MFLAVPASAAPVHAAGGHGSVRATKIRPHNAPSTSNEATAVPQYNTGQAAWVNGSNGILYANGNNETWFGYNSSAELVIENGKYVGECLYYDESGGDFDALACDASKTSDQWVFGDTSNNFSEWQSVYNANECVWFQGAGDEIKAETCDGNSEADRWNWNANTEP
jgi:hypothetical protein